MQAERFLTTAEAAKLLGMAARTVYRLQATGMIQSVCMNPDGQRKRYMTTHSRLAAWQNGIFAQPQKKTRKQPVQAAEEGLWEYDKDGARRVARRH